MTKERETILVRRGFVYLMILWCAIALIFGERAEAAERYWRGPVTVTYDDPRIVPYLEYAIWSLSERTGHDVSLGWRASQGATGYIHVSVISDAQMTATRHSGVVGYVQPYVYTADRSRMARADMYIRESALTSGCTMRTVVHEMTHAMGVHTHSESIHDVMYSSLLWCILDRYTLSFGDLMLLDATGYDADFCWAELNQRGDLYAPAAAGFSAELKLRDGYWSLWELVNGGFCGGTMDGGVVTLHDARSATGERYRGSLNFDGERFTVIEVEQFASRMMADDYFGGEIVAEEVVE